MFPFFGVNKLLRDDLEISHLMATTIMEDGDGNTDEARGQDSNSGASKTPCEKGPGEEVEGEDDSTKWRLSYGGRYCCVVNCHNNAYKHGPLGIKFHIFPKNLDRRLLWIKSVRRAVPGKPGALWQPKKHDVVCSEHFVGGRKSNDKDSASYVPSIFPTHLLPGHSEQSLARSQRRAARSVNAGKSVVRKGQKPEKCKQGCIEERVGDRDEETGASAEEEDEEQEELPDVLVGEHEQQGTICSK